MTGRDRMVLIGAVVLAALAATWVLVVSPEREKASKLAAQVTAAHAELSTAEGQLATARSAQSQYTAAYAAVVSLGKAVPPSQEVPSLIYQLSQASNRRSVQFASITSGAGATTSPSPTPAAAASTGAASTGAASTGFSEMPFTFVFEGSFFDLERLFGTLTNFTTNKADGALEVSGRLLTIQSVKLSPEIGASEPSNASRGNLSGTITATAYVLPASQGLTGSATPTSPTGSSTTVASAGAAPSSPTPAAIARVNP
jgi:hypothetical protein